MAFGLPDIGIFRIYSKGIVKCFERLFIRTISKQFLAFFQPVTRGVLLRHSDRKCPKLLSLGKGDVCL